jgi:hypothetical protein
MKKVKMKAIQMDMALARERQCLKKSRKEIESPERRASHLKRRAESPSVRKRKARRKNHRKKLSTQKDLVQRKILRRRAKRRSRSLRQSKRLMI